MVTLLTATDALSNMLFTSKFSEFLLFILILWFVARANINNAITSGGAIIVIIMARVKQIFNTTTSFFLIINFFPLHFFIINFIFRKKHSY